MAMAPILVGIIAGILSFTGALISGHGLLLALAWYAGGGLLGAVVMGLIVVVRTATRSARPATPGLAVIRT